jgi:SAM-dependent methyltransferase
MITTSLLKRTLRKIFPTADDLLEKELRGCQSVLDLGCGPNSPIQHFDIPYSVGVDAFEPYLGESKRKKIHDEHILADIRKIQFKPKSFDGVLALEVLEHLTKGEGYELLLKKMENIAKKKIIITTPNGFVPHEEHDANIFQLHKSGWTVDELKKLGFRVMGFGLIGLGGKKSKILELLFTAITYHITLLYPKLAARLFAVKVPRGPREF